MAITRNEEMPLYISTIDLEFAFGQVKLHPETSKHCNIAIIGGDATVYYQFKNGFYGLTDMPTIFQENIDKTLENQTRPGKMISSLPPGQPLRNTWNK